MIIVAIMMDEIKEKDSENSFLFLGITFALLVLSLPVGFVRERTR